MKKIDKHIEIVRCGIPRLSSMGLKSCNAIHQVLSRHFTRVGITHVNNETDLALLIAKQPDLVFLGFKNMPTAGEGYRNIWISEQLDNAGINYTGSGKAAMILDHNKGTAKQTVLDAGLLTAPYFSASLSEHKSIDDLPLSFPLFVKPPLEGGGRGIDSDSVVRDFAGFRRKVTAIDSKFGTPALVEKYLVGREFSVALLETTDGTDILALPIELITQPNELGDQILSHKVKSDDVEHVIAVPDGSLRESLISLAVDVFKVLNARDYGRIDIRMDELGKLYFLEANLIPGVAKHDFTSYFTSACWINLNMNHEAMLLAIVELGLARNPLVPAHIAPDSGDVFLKPTILALEPV